MKKLILYIISVVVLLGMCCCSPIREVPVHTSDTLTVYKTDTLYLHRIDSTIIHAKNDTVFIEKYKILWRDKICYRDSIQIQEKEIPVEVPVPTVPKWCWWLLAGVIAYILIRLAIFVIRIYLKR